MADGRARVSTAVETPPAAKRVSPWAAPSDQHLDEVARYVRSAKRRLADATLNPSDYLPEPVLSATELKAIELWETRDYEWYSKAKGAEMPRRYWSSNLYQGLQTPAVRAARQFCEGADEEESAGEAASCLGLLGPVGVGKTVAAAGVLRVSGEDIRFFDVRDLSRRLMNPLQREEALEQALSTFAIVLDDIGAAYVRADSFLEGMLEEIFVHREARDGVTVFTSNLTRRQLDDAVGLRVADRLAGPWGSIHELPGKSLRRERP
ncbi:MAG: hypothetical protein Q7W02_00070 [Candidatus Rokubacteria bacterium]|nr:hypothetical protein [Candidatus Rokubacteria bacterium]